MFLRDCDGQHERFNALEQVRKQYPNRTILIGFAVDRIEAWVLAAFEPENETEETLLEHEKRFIGFDPTCRPHELTAKAGDAKKNPKRVLESLFSRRGNNRQVYAEIINSVEWEHLEKDQRGVYCGMLPFCNEIRERLVTRF